VGMTEKVRAMSDKELTQAYRDLSQRKSLGGLDSKGLAALTVVTIEMRRRGKQ
jgi:hypothetical protein